MKILTAHNRIVRAKARNAVTLRRDPLILMQHALADRWFSRYKRIMRRELNAQLREATARIKNGAIEPVTMGMMIKWERRLLEAKRKPVMAMVRSGIELTDSVEFGKSMNYFPGVLGPDTFFKDIFGKADYVGLEMVGYDEDDIFLHHLNFYSG